MLQLAKTLSKSYKESTFTRTHIMQLWKYQGEIVGCHHGLWPLFLTSYSLIRFTPPFFPECFITTQMKKRQKISPLVTNLYLEVSTIFNIDVTRWRVKTITQLFFLASLFNPSKKFQCGQVSTKNAVLQTASQKVDRICQKNWHPRKLKKLGFCHAAAEAVVAGFICVFISFLMNKREESINMEKKLLSLKVWKR